MAGNGADMAARARPPRASAGAKGKSVGTVIDLVDDTSSKGTTAGLRSTATTDNPEVVCSDGKD